ncbi:MAG TPA: cytochrome c biogenesis protein CcsA [Planctomycetaceae bacterium]|nr:cytochrome c biogenesis protein CcsA [Planctomycetaceae bacterium]
MATQTFDRKPLVLAEDHGRDAARSVDGVSPLAAALGPLASLKLTVVLFALAIVLVFASTLAQHRKGIWQVINQYYSTPVAKIEFQDLRPTSFFGAGEVAGWFPFPGGALIGALMAVNLLAAHATRFRIRGRGVELPVGLAILAVGILAIWLVIASGSNKDGFQHAASIEWGTLWKLMKIGVGALFLSALYGTIFALVRTQTPYWWRGLCVAGTLGLGALFVFVLRTGPLNDSAMRILWQLTKAQLAAMVLLAGCIPLFKKRAGIVVIHAGVGLMLTQLFVGIGIVESQMRIEEGETVNYAQDIRSIELAVTDRAPERAYETAYIPEWLEKQDRPLAEKADNVVVVPGSLLTTPGRRISDERLPFDIEVIEFQQNSRVDETPQGQSTHATAGAGLRYYARRVDPTTGTDDKVDSASAYVRFFHKDSRDAIGTYLLSQWLKPQPITAGGRTYELDLRFKRDYKPYAITLKDIQKQDYIGTSTPRDYSSFIELRDPERNVDREVRIWMNNPLRYAGETFYQSGYHRDMATFTDPATGQQRPVLETDTDTGERRPKFIETTTLQVVANTGWMIPYVSCMIVLTGMLAHFSLILVRFLNRRAVEEHVVQAGRRSDEALAGRAAPEPPQIKAARRAALAGGAGIRKLEEAELREPLGAGSRSGDWQTIAGWAVAAVLVLLAAGYALGKLFPHTLADGAMDYRAFGEIPIVDGGRDKPLDTLARYSLQKISGRETFVGRMDFPRLNERWPEIKDRLSRRWSQLSADDFAPFDARLEKKLQDDARTFVSDLDSLVVARVGAPPAEVRSRIEALMASEDDETRSLAARWQNTKAQLSREWPQLTGKDFAPFDERFERGFEDGPNAFANDLIDAAARKTSDSRSEVAAFVDALVSEKQQAIRWLLDLMAMPEDAYAHKVIYIPTLDVLSSLGLERRKGFRYAIAEFRDKLGEIGQQAHKARELQDKSGPAALDTYQRKILELERKLGVVYGLVQAFKQPPIRDENALADLRRAISEQQDLERQQPPLAIPPWKDAKTWQTFAMASVHAWIQEHVTQDAPNPVFVALQETVEAYAAGDDAGFRKGIDGYWNAFKEHKPTDVNVAKVTYEAFYNWFAPLFSPIWIYLAAFVVAAVGWMGWSKPLNRAALGLVLFAFAVHTYGLVARIYISGRPPVTNLYSSAVFIAWGTVLLGVIVELIYRRGYGTVIAAVAGFKSLLIAWHLSESGDTFTVLQAVLDTQFWLATHVTCITLGYATTFVAGLLGLIYVVRGSRPAPLFVGFGMAGLAWYFFARSTWEYAALGGAFSALAAVSCIASGALMLGGVFQPEFPAEDRRNLTRMTYGSLCFAIFFSFIGTVLGGLWADDSWGRFWGWDPKENGALMIVLWNALVLHARWDGWVKDRGLAVLAIGGNVITAWSWFGVNELGVGLHSYGFTEGVLLALGVFAVSQVVMMGLGCLPRELWWHDRHEGRPEATV